MSRREYGLIIPRSERSEAILLDSMEEFLDQMDGGFWHTDTMALSIFGRMRAMRSEVSMNSTRDNNYCLKGLGDNYLLMS